MIQLRSDCLVFELSNGEAIPCSAELVAIEMMGDAASVLDPELIRNAAAAVLHYFKEEQGKEYVSVGEFSMALERVLRAFGLEVKSGAMVPTEPGRVVVSDLRQLACDSGKGFELVFFSRLRHEFETRMDESPRVLQFTGLRSCVKQLVGAQRWTNRCQVLSDQIVEYLRTCLGSGNSRDCALVVQ